MPDIHAIAGFADPVASMLHLFAAPAAVLFGYYLWQRGRGESLRSASLLVYATGVVMLLAFSGTYHMLTPGETPRFVLRHLDFASIWILIAGTFTPMHIIALRGFWRWNMLAIIWGIAIVGITLDTIWLENIPGWLASASYLALGWVGALSAWRITRHRNVKVVLDCMWGGIAYSVGATLEAVGYPTLIPGVVGPHELFHVGVLVGIAFHARFVWRLATESTTGEAIVDPERIRSLAAGKRRPLPVRAQPSVAV